MARIKGQANYASNFEVLKQAPLDSRTVVSDSGDLTKAATWRDADGNVWLYDGLIVVVPNTNNPSAPEVYVLKDKDNYGRPDAWLKLGADNASAVAAIQETLKKKANLVDGKVSSEELPIVTSLKQEDYTTIPSAKLVDEALTAVGNTLEEKINNKVVGLLNWQGVKSTTSEIKAITSAKKGDVWHSNGDGSEWVCIKEDGISTADATAWEELGTSIDLSGYYDAEKIGKKIVTNVTGAWSESNSNFGISVTTRNPADETESASSFTIELADENNAGLMSNDEHVKLKNIEADANNYTHPTHTAHASGFYKITVDNLGHVSATTPVVAKDLTDLGVATATSVSDLETSLGNKISGLDTKIGTINTTIGNVDDSTGNSLYAKINANTKNISTKANSEDLTALQSKVELKANQSDIPTAVQLVVKTI